MVEEGAGGGAPPGQLPERGWGGGGGELTDRLGEGAGHWNLPSCDSPVRWPWGPEGHNSNQGVAGQEDRALGLWREP